LKYNIAEIPIMTYTYTWNECFRRVVVGSKKIHSDLAWRDSARIPHSAAAAAAAAALGGDRRQ
jgi:hypothetical protein